MITLNLTYVDRKERISARTNKPYTSISIKCKEYGDNFLSGFGNKDNAGWREGDTVEVLEVKTVEKEGKTYYNFEMPKASKADDSTVIDLLTEQNNKLMSIIFSLATIETIVNEIKNPVHKAPYPEMTEENNANLTDEEMASYEQHNQPRH